MKKKLESETQVIEPMMDKINSLQAENLKYLDEQEALKKELNQLRADAAAASAAGGADGDEVVTLKEQLTKKQDECKKLNMKLLEVVNKFK